MQEGEKMSNADIIPLVIMFIMITVFGLSEGKDIGYHKGFSDGVEYQRNLNEKEKS
jgi:hypothetical protein